MNGEVFVAYRVPKAIRMNRQIPSFVFAGSLVLESCIAENTECSLRTRRSDSAYSASPQRC
jgi:hypothetical protein